MSRWVKSLIKRHLILFLTGMSVLITRVRVMGSTAPLFTENDNPHSFVNGTMLRVLNYNYIYAMNAWLLLNPWWLCCDWSMGCIPVITSLADSRILADIALWVVFGALFYHCCVGELTRTRSVLIMSLAVLGVPFLPASNLFFRVGFVIAERNLYLSCAGFCMLVVLGARHICLHLHSFKQRCQEYGGRKTLYTSALKVCPLNAKEGQKERHRKKERQRRGEEGDRNGQRDRKKGRRRTGKREREMTERRKRDKEGDRREKGQKEEETEDREEGTEDRRRGRRQGREKEGRDRDRERDRKERQRQRRRTGMKTETGRRTGRRDRDTEGGEDRKERGDRGRRTGRRRQEEGQTQEKIQKGRMDRKER
ncbi:protein O-mannosyl-transferase TMTC4-like [Haliotis rubra]|uniref:protein O-mannosyl-transferase TMTC4-like n=1 Tax=Haliotis rubra TaxID=36100 RepID=UPI001EE516FD|nr:protein O-mannosyl-transferase TMTC4-like [Haliotis rubra]